MLILILFVIVIAPTDSSRLLEIEPVQQFELDESIQECSICLQPGRSDDELNPLVTFGCGEPHYFHRACRSGWIIRSPTCPLCRSRVSRSRRRERIQVDQGERRSALVVAAIISFAQFVAFVCIVIVPRISTQMQIGTLSNTSLDDMLANESLDQFERSVLND